MAWAAMMPTQALKVTVGPYQHFQDDLKTGVQAPKKMSLKGRQSTYMQHFAKGKIHSLPQFQESEERWSELC